VYGEEKKICEEKIFFRPLSVKLFFKLVFFSRAVRAKVMQPALAKPFVENTVAR
jgi:hypothetical protein